MLTSLFPDAGFLSTSDFIFLADESDTRSFCTSISALADNAIEENEVFQITLVSPTPLVGITQSNYEVTIIDSTGIDVDTCNRYKQVVLILCNCST
jgi:hypothetical protein